MLTTQTKELLDRLRAGQFDLSDVSAIEQIPARSFVQDLAASFPVTFQERTVKNKWEIGLARTIRYELSVRSGLDSTFPVVGIGTVLRGCMLVSCYDDMLGEITSISSVRVWRIRRPLRGLAVRMGRGCKLDRTPDGWQVKSLEAKTARLTEEFLKKRGWRFAVLSPLGGKP